MTEKFDPQTVPSWNLSAIYDSFADTRIVEDLASAKALLEDFTERYQGKITYLSGQQLAEAFAAREKIAVLESKLGLYAVLSKIDNMQDAFVAEAAEKLQQSVRETLEQPLQFFMEELSQCSPERVESLLKETPALQKYNRFLKDLTRDEVKTLSEQETQEVRRLVDEQRAAANKWWDARGASAEFRGQNLTRDELWDAAREFTDEASRKEIYAAIQQIGEEMQTLTAEIANDVVSAYGKIAALRGFKEPIEAMHHENGMNAEMVDAMLEAIEANYDVTTVRFGKLYAEALGKEKLDPWDAQPMMMLPPLPATNGGNLSVSWEMARDLIVSAYTEFDVDMGKIAAQMFDQHLIEMSHRAERNKAYGMCTSGVGEDAPAFIVLPPYTGKLTDVLMLAHEIGHAIHYQIGAKVHGSYLTDSGLALSETASIFGEELVFRKLIEKFDSPDNRKELLAAKTSLELMTIAWGAANADFETKLHEACKDGPLTGEQIAEIWDVAHEKREGDSVNREEQPSDLTWTGWSHYLMQPFYSYAYSFGGLLVQSLFQAYDEGKIPNFKEKYRTLLEESDSKSLDELMEPFGLNPRDPEFWEKGLEVIRKRIDLFEEVLKEEKGQTVAGKHVNSENIRRASGEKFQLRA